MLISVRVTQPGVELVTAEAHEQNSAQEGVFLFPFHGKHQMSVQPASEFKDLYNDMVLWSILQYVHSHVLCGHLHNFLSIGF